MLNHPLVTLLLTSLLASVVGYLINQWPAIREFPGRNTLVIKLTIEVVVLTGIVGGWNATTDKNEAFKVLFQSVGCITLLLFIWHTSQLILSLWWTRGERGGTFQSVNGKTGRKTPNEWRQELLEAMNVYVTARLNDSLHNDKIIPLQVENRQEQVGRPAQAQINNNSSSWLNLIQPQRLLKVFGVSDSVVESGKPIIEIFEQPDIKGRLLILGDPGSGKTTMLLELGQDLIARAQQQLDCPIPVLFELTNWKDDQQKIGDWLIADLKFRYNVPETISRQWLNTDKLLPLLDGLDELGLIRQQKCIEQINDFLQNNSSLLPLVVCCRQEEYIKGEAILGQLRGAVCTQPLTLNQIQNYLRWLRCFHLWQPIKDDPDGLGKLAEIPLFLHLIPVAYPKGLIKQGKYFNSEDERKAYQEKCRKDLFDAYLKQRLDNHHDRNGYDPEDTQRWLTWLAKKMKKQKIKEFYIENLQIDYLENWRECLTYCLLSGIIIGIIFGIVFVGLGGIFGLINGLLSRGFFVLFVAIGCGLIFAIHGFPYQTPFNIFLKIEPIETVGWSWIKVSTGIIAGLILGSFYGLALAVQFPQINGQRYGWIIGIIYGICIGMTGDKLTLKNIANQGIKQSAKNAVIFMFITFPCGILIFTPSIIISRVYLAPDTLVLLSLNFAFIFGIVFGGIPVIQHFALRLVLWHSGSIPWNYARFLSYTDERRLIQQVGGRYQFIHDLLQEHFASM